LAARRAVASAGPNAIPCRSRGPESNAQIVEIVTEKLIIAVTFDPERGYVGTAPELRQPVIALSLGGSAAGALIGGNPGHSPGRLALAPEGYRAGRWWRQTLAGLRGRRQKAGRPHQYKSKS